MRSATSRVTRALVPAVIVVTAVLAWTTRVAAWVDHEIVSQDENHITFTVRLPAYQLEEMTSGGTAYTRILASELAPIAETGEPDIPAFAIMLAVPHGAEARLGSFSRSGDTVHEGVRILPVARLEASQGEDAARFAEDIYDEDKSIYDGTSPFPATSVWLTDRGRLRYQDVVRVFVSPFVYEPAAERLVVSREITVTVAFEGPARELGAVPAEDRWEGVYHDVLLNYEQGRRWRARRGAPLLRSEVTNDRLKILIEKTGIQKVDFDSAGVAGFPGDIPVDELFLYRDEFSEGTPDTLEVVESAIEIHDNDQDGFFSSGDQVFFYGRDLRDQFGYRGNEDMFFDYNVYWLSWGAGPHKRMESRSGWRESSAPSRPEHFSDFVHMEKDVYFSNFPPLNAAYEPYDLFYWAQYNPDLTFGLPGVHPDYPCSLVVNFISYYNTPRTDIRSVTIYVKSCGGVRDTLATKRMIYIPGNLRLRYGVEPGFLCDADNVFSFRSDAQPYDVPGHTVDWFEVFYEREFEAYENNLRFTNGGVTGELEFEVSDFSASDVRLYDVSDPLSPVRLDVPSEHIQPDDGTFSITFRDSVGGDRKYISCSPEGLVDVGIHQLSLVDPPALRDVAASYIAISHPDFAASLDPLIAKRREQGHTAVVATTEEVYDDFGNGMKSDVAIKRFIKQAFFEGGTEFVLLVGDANVDRKGYLNEPHGGQGPSGIDYLPSHNRIMGDVLAAPNLEIRPNENWFVMVDGPDDVYPDLYLGRLSVGSVGEAQGVVAKILAFENDPGSDPWKKRMILVADDQFGTSKPDPNRLCYTGQDQFEAGCESTAVIVTDFALVPVDTSKHYLTRCLADDQPSVRAAHGCPNFYTTRNYTRNHCTPRLIDDMNQGALMVNFECHANRYQFTHEELIWDFKTPGLTDVVNLDNGDKPFIFLGFGCWISDFQWLLEPSITDAIGEKFLLNPGGAACASFASGCSEPIISNEEFNGFVTRAFFTRLQGKDPHGEDIPARVLLGEAIMTSLLRYGNVSYMKAYVLLGDPAMVVDLGPPAITASVDGSPIDESYVYEGEVFDTVHIAGEIEDEEAIMEIAIEIVTDEATTTVPSDAYSEVALIDTEYVRSRSYRVTYDHVPLLGDYAVRMTGTDYAQKSSSFDVHVATGSAEYFADGEELADGGQIVFGQQLEVLLTRPQAFAEDDIEVLVDTIPAEEFDPVIEMKDGEGKQWQVSFTPSLDPGAHEVSVSVQGFGDTHGFQYVPAHFDFFVNGRPLYDGDYVSRDAEFAIALTADAEITEDDVGVELDGEPLNFAFAPDSSGWRITFGRELEPGDHTLSVTMFSVPVERQFSVSDELMLTDVSVYPNPFWSETRIFYTLSREVDEVKVSIFTISGRLIREVKLTPFVNYNEFVWDGRDDRGDRVANGTYFYRVVASSSSGERESTGWVVKVE